MSVTSSVGLDWMDDDFDPKNLANTGKVEELSDGEYELAVKDAALKYVDKLTAHVLEMKMEVLTEGKHAGQKVQHSLFIKDKDSRDRTLRDLAKLGFDVDQWTKENSRPISQELPKVPKVLKGLRIKAKKATNKDKDSGKTYHNLYINKRGLDDGKPEKLGPEQLDAPDEGDWLSS